MQPRDDALGMVEMSTIEWHSVLDESLHADRAVVSGVHRDGLASWVGA